MVYGSLHRLPGTSGIPNTGRNQLSSSVQACGRCLLASDLRHMNFKRHQLSASEGCSLRVLLPHKANLLLICSWDCNMLYVHCTVFT